MSAAIFFCDLTIDQINMEAKSWSSKEGNMRDPQKPPFENMLLFMPKDGGKSQEEKKIQASVKSSGEKLSKKLDDLSADLIACACHIYHADRMIARPHGWFRDLEFHIGVNDQQLWERNARQLQTIISFLTRDTIRIRFYNLLRKRDPLSLPELAGQRNGGVCVFGDSLDAVAGAALVNNTNAIVASFRYGSESSGEYEVLNHIERLTHSLDYVGFEINPQGIVGRDPTQRTRGFLNLALAAVVARTIGTDKIEEIQVFGNGISSYHLYETQLCGSGYAVRDTHPFFLNKAQLLFQGLFSESENFKIINQFQYLTPSAILEQLINNLSKKEARRLYGKINGCSERTMADLVGKSHCGCCFSCKVRRLAALGVKLEKPGDCSAYATNPLVRDVSSSLKNKIDPDSHHHQRVQSFHEKGLFDLKRFIESFLLPTDAEIMELVDIGREIRRLISPTMHFSGSRAAANMQKEIINLHRRFTKEALPYLRAKKKKTGSGAKKRTALRAKKGVALGTKKGNALRHK